jgi:hypothetical protein
MNRNHLYLGKAGQSFVMSEFLVRGWNVAVPEVDVGDDMFVIHDQAGEFVRIQVKTSNIIERQKGFSAQFSVPIPQLKRIVYPELTYCFVMRSTDKWQEIVVISRKELSDLFDSSNIGSQLDDTLMLYFSFKDNQVWCSKVDFTSFLNNFDKFPKIQSL